MPSEATGAPGNNWVPTRANATHAATRAVIVRRAGRGKRAAASATRSTARVSTASATTTAATLPSAAAIA